MTSARSETGAQRLARQRRDAADRKRAERARAREAGRPDPAALDRAIADAVRAALVQRPDGQRLLLPLDPRRLIAGAAHALTLRTAREVEEGKEHKPYDREAVAAALSKRLLEPSPRVSVKALPDEMAT